MTGRPWAGMRPGDFDTAAPDQQLAMTPAPDVCGTPELDFGLYEFPCDECGAAEGVPCDCGK